MSRDSRSSGSAGTQPPRRNEVNKPSKTIAAATLIALLIPAAASAADDQPDDTDQLPTPEVVESDEVNEVEDYDGWTVYHWTSDGTATEPLDASVAANRDVDNFAGPLAEAALTDTKTVAATDSSTLDIDPPPPPPPPPGGFTCSTLVGPMEYDDNQDQLEADVGQTCIGAFTEQWMGAQFERDQWGWRWTGYGGTNVSGETFQSELDVRWTAPCGGGGSYRYRLNVISYAQSTDGTIVPSPGYTGGNLRENCGTGF